MSSASAYLSVENAKKSYPTRAGGEALTILNNVSFSCEKGSSAAIVGPSGSGKSTLLNIIGALDDLDSGDIRLDGVDVAALSPNEKAHFRNRDIGFIFQSHYLLPHLSALENVLTPTLAQSTRCSDEARDRATELLAKVGLSERVSHTPAQLSGGERQRVAVVRALINQPKLLLADEPTGALDPTSAAALGDLLVSLNEEERVTLIVVTHSLELAARMGRIFELRSGQLSETTGAR